MTQDFIGNKSSNVDLSATRQNKQNRHDLFDIYVYYMTHWQIKSQVHFFICVLLRAFAFDSFTMILSKSFSTLFDLKLTLFSKD